MSKSTVEQLIGKMMLDGAFRASVTANPSQALAGYDLTDEERAAFAQMDASAFDAAASRLDTRLSKTGLGEIEPNFMKKLGSALE